MSYETYTSIQPGEYFAKLYTNRLASDLVVPFTKTRIAKVFEKVTKLQEEQKFEEAIELLTKNAKNIHDEYYERNPSFFMLCTVKGMFYNYLAACYRSLVVSDTGRMEALKNIRLALIYDIWQLIFDMNYGDEKNSFDDLVTAHYNEMPSVQLLRTILEDYKVSIQEFTEEDLFLLNKEFICAGMAYDLITFYSRDLPGNVFLVRATEMKLVAECMYTISDDVGLCQKISACARDIMKGIIRPDDIDNCLQVLETEFTECAPAEPFVSEWTTEDFNFYSTAAEYLAARMHPAFKPSWYYRYKVHSDTEQIQFFKGELSDKRSTINSLTDKVASLEREVAEKNNEISMLKAEKGELTRKNIGLENKLEEVSRSQDALSKSVANQKRSANGANRKQNKELVKLSMAYDNLRSKFNELSQQKEDYVHKYQDAISEKIALSDKISELREELRKKTKALEAQTVQEVVEEEPVAVTEEELAEKDIFADTNLKIAVAGGTDSWRAKVIARHPKFKDIGNSKGFDTQKLNDVDLLVINTNNVSHACTMKASANTPESGKILYTSYYNLDLLDAQIKGRIE